MNYILFCVLLFASSACQHGGIHSTQKMQYAAKYTLQQQKLVSAKNLHDIGDHHAAIAMVRLLIDNAVYSPVIDDAYLLMIEWLLEIRRDSEAKRWASQFFRQHKDSPACNKIIALLEQRPPEVSVPIVTDISDRPREVASTNDSLFLDFNDVMSNKADYETSKNQ